MKKIIILSVITIAIVTVIVACSNISGNNEKNSAISQKDSATRVARGEYLVTTTGCDDCHSPKKMGANGPELIPELRFSGFPKDGKLPGVNKAEIGKGWMLFAPDLTAAVGQWGVSFAGNISSDETGIGNWKEENFVRALREGKFKGLAGGRPLLPPMPWFAYKNMADEDLKSIFAYLKTTKPVHNVVPAPIPLGEIK
jgi:mono/diheme cytochrome c family protein